MKTLLTLLVCTIPLLAVAQDQDHQRPQRDQGRGPGHRPPPSPLMEALDRDHDGILSAQEISGAAAALLELDTNKDGQLTRDELRPKRPMMGPEEQGASGPGEQLPPPPPEQP